MKNEALLLKTACMNLLSHYLPEEYIAFEEGLTSLNYVVEDKVVQVLLDWNGDYSEKRQGKLIHGLRLTCYGENGTSEFFVGFKSHRWIWGYYSSSLAVGMSRDQIALTGEMIPLNNIPPYPPLSPVVAEIKRQRWMESQNTPLVTPLAPIVMNPKLEAQKKMIFDLLKALPPYKDDLVSIRAFADFYMQENPNFVFTETNGSSVVPAFRRWRAAHL